MGNIDLERVGNLTRFTADLNLANDLFQHALLLFNAYRLTRQVKRHGNFDLLSLNEPREISMNQATLNRIDLPIVKHDFTLTHAFDLDREDRISSCFSAQN